MSAAMWASTLISVESKYSVDESVAKLTQMIEAKKGFGVFSVIDHAKGAKKVGLTMNPAKVIIFGNPMAGTKLMLLDPQMAYELPMKILVRQDANGKVYAEYRDVKWLAKNYDIAKSPILKKMTKLLFGLTTSLTK